MISGIVVPQINTAAEAQAVVSHSKFPPQGLRGQGSAFPALTHGIDIPTYMKTANDTLITCVQIESVAGVQNVDAICAVPGVGKQFVHSITQNLVELIRSRHGFHWP
jgi:4-hydroxy-2-oxoheptanedioate aldolase